MSNPLLVIRADASSKIGAGHLMRCLAIAQAWRRQGGEVTFACAEISDALVTRLNEEGINTAPITASIGSPADAAQTLAIAAQRSNQTADQKTKQYDATQPPAQSDPEESENDGEITVIHIPSRSEKKLQSGASNTDVAFPALPIIVIDGYEFDADYHAAITQFGGITLALDDCGTLPYYQTDFVLNQNLGADATLYPRKAPHTKLLLGTQYALLRQEFLNSNRDLIELHSTLRILVTLGGSDPHNATSKAIIGLQKLRRDDLEVRVIVGGLSLNLNAVAQLVRNDKRIQLLQDVQDMSRQYLWADLAIAAAGSSNWEMCYFGLPRIVLVIAENQFAAAAELQRAKVAINLGDAAQVSPEQICAAIDSLMQNQAQRDRAWQNSLALVDGRGAQRVVEAIVANV